MSDSLRSHGLQHTRPPCPSPTPRCCSNSGPSSQWCHPTISSSVVPFSSCLQSFPASGSFPMCQFFASGGQSIGVSEAHIGLQKFMYWLPYALHTALPPMRRSLRAPSSSPRNRNATICMRNSAPKVREWALGHVGTLCQALKIPDYKKFFVVSQNPCSSW